MSLGDRIHVACVAAGISQAELARRVPCKPQQITDLAKNKRGFSKHFPRMAEVLGVRVEWLTTGEGPWKPGVGEAAPQPISPDIGAEILREIRSLRVAVDEIRPGAKFDEAGRVDRDLASLPHVTR
jgi:transcriptional regulator with XRE-family HTH domain